jgi:hypothetical protein
LDPRSGRLGKRFLRRRRSWIWSLFGAEFREFRRLDSLDDELYQTLATVPGTTYTISFYLAHPASNTANDFSVDFGGVQGFSIVNAGAFDYTLETFNVTATSTSTVLAFFGRENPSWFDLDNVSVTSTSIPEASTWAMLIAGFAGLGLAGRRARRSHAAIA